MKTIGNTPITYLTKREYFATQVLQGLLSNPVKEGAKYGEILGAHMIGPEVSELLPELTLAQKMEMTVEEIAQNIHAHPTLSEVLMEAAEAVNGSAIHT